ncbi:MAG: hypothetical protein MMC23_004255 [Stictis urceolatum]|nr:hypothetical protein [Stictis urceolata]
MLPSRAIDTSGELLDALQEGSETLQNITDMFVPLMKNFHVYFFWEQEKTDMGYTQDYVVDESSAAPILDNTERTGLPYDHRNMCKFGSRNAPGYRVVVSALMRYSRGAPEVIANRWVHSVERLKAQRQQEAEELLR